MKKDHPIINICNKNIIRNEQKQSAEYQNNQCQNKVVEI